MRNIALYSVNGFLKLGVGVGASCNVAPSILPKSVCVWGGGQLPPFTNALAFCLLLLTKGTLYNSPDSKNMCGVLNTIGLGLK